MGKPGYHLSQHLFGFCEVEYRKGRVFFQGSTRAKDVARGKESRVLGHKWRCDDPPGEGYQPAGAEEYHFCECYADNSDACF